MLRSFQSVFPVVIQRVSRCAASLFFCLLLVVLCVPNAHAHGTTPAGSHSIRLTFSTFPSQGMGILFGRILTEAYSTIGLDIAIRRLPAARALEAANEGQTDGEAGRVSVIEEDNPNLIRVPTPIYLNHVVCFTKRKDIDPRKGWDGLAPYSLASVVGYKFIEKKTLHMRRKLVASYDVLFAMLESDRVDAVLTEYLEALPTLKGLEMEDVHMLEPPYAAKPMYHYLHKKHADLVPRIDAVLKHMQKTGRLQAILKEMEREYASRWSTPSFSQ